MHIDEFGKLRGTEVDIEPTVIQNILNVVRSSLQNQLNEHVWIILIMLCSHQIYLYNIGIE